MSEILIKVRGSHSVEVPPEIGVVHAEVATAGATPEAAMERLQQDVRRLRADLERLSRDDVVDRFVLQRARTWVTEHPAPPEHTADEWLSVVQRASIGLRVEFTDFEGMAAWVGHSPVAYGVGVNGTSWRLTKETRLSTERAVRREAVRQAKVRAQDYADALDLGPVSVRSINDVGVSRDVAYASMPVGADMEMAPDLAFSPDDITVYAEVEAEFAVGPSV
ncbi:SIMPL domain-containing protein [Nocardioides sp. CCNWLW239]|uniref:SIMPL domain-containing protein n=1 Tax=Nocardioides sp. CCNWLW239 TaxID=3128902 RepID=UPI003016A70B